MYVNICKQMLTVASAESCNWRGRGIYFWPQDSSTLDIVLPSMAFAWVQRFSIEIKKKHNHTLKETWKEINLVKTYRPVLAHWPNYFKSVKSYNARTIKIEKIPTFLFTRPSVHVYNLESSFENIDIFPKILSYNQDFRNLSGISVVYFYIW